MSPLAKVGIQDGLGGILLTALGTIVLTTSKDYVWFTKSGVVGPAVLPGACGALLILFGVAQIAQWALARRAASRAEQVTSAPVGHTVADGTAQTPGFAEAMSTEEGTDDTGASAGGGSRHAWLAWAGVAVSVLLIPLVGLIPAIGLVALYLLNVVSRKSWLIASLYAVGLAVGLYLLFVVALGIPLPMPDWIG